MQKIPGFLKLVDNTSLVYDSDGELRFYVPEKYFTNKSAEVLGNSIILLGTIQYGLKKGNKETLNIFSYPSRITCTPTEIVKEKNIVVGKADADDYRILIFKKGDVVVDSIYTVQELVNVEDLFRIMVLSGNIPNFIPYEDLYNYFLYPMEVNGGNYGISAQAFGVFVAKLCRQKNNLDKEFRLSKNKLKNNTNYTSISIKTVPKYTSPYTAITSENWDESVVAALMNNNKVDVPLEKLMTK